MHHTTSTHHNTSAGTVESLRGNPQEEISVAAPFCLIWCNSPRFSSVIENFLGISRYFLIISLFFFYH